MVSCAVWCVGMMACRGGVGADREGQFNGHTELCVRACVRCVSDLGLRVCVCVVSNCVSPASAQLLHCVTRVYIFVCRGAGAVCTTALHVVSTSVCAVG